MSTDYAEIAAAALESLQDAGAAMTLTVPGAATYDPATGTATATPATHACTGVLLPPGAMRGTGLVFAVDVVARSTAWVLLGASGLTATPTPGCKLTLGSETWTVIGADTLRPSGVAVLHGLALVSG